jgi:hypothetical protein
LHAVDRLAIDIDHPQSQQPFSGRLTVHVRFKEAAVKPIDDEIDQQPYGGADRTQLGERNSECNDH